LIYIRFIAEEAVFPTENYRALVEAAADKVKKLEEKYRQKVNAKQVCLEAD